MLHAGAKAAFKRKRAANPGMKRGQMTNGFDDDEGGGKLARPLPLGLDWGRCCLGYVIWLRCLRIAEWLRPSRCRRQEEEEEGQGCQGGGQGFRQRRRRRRWRWGLWGVWGAAEEGEEGGRGVQVAEEVQAAVTRGGCWLARCLCERMNKETNFRTQPHTRPHVLSPPGRSAELGTLAAAARSAAFACASRSQP